MISFDNFKESITSKTYFSKYMDKFVKIKKKELPKQDVQTIIDNEGAIVELYKGFLSKEDSLLLYKELQASPHWNFDMTMTKGGLKQTHRLVMSMAEESYEPSDYSYPNSTNPLPDTKKETTDTKESEYVNRKNHPFTPLISKAKQLIEEQTKTKYNFAYLNLYRNGKDHLGWHADKEEVPNATIASLSLGEARDFMLRHIGQTRLAQELEDSALRREALEQAKMKVQLESGDLLIMRGRTQQVYHHHVPPRVNSVDPRINITFRTRE